MHSWLQDYVLELKQGGEEHTLLEDVPFAALMDDAHLEGKREQFVMLNCQGSPMRCQSSLLLLALSFWTSCDGCGSQPGSPDAASAMLATEGVPFDNVVLLAAGNDETCVVVASGATYCAGGSLEGYNPTLSMARRVAGADHTTQLSIGESACAVQESGQVICWSESRNEVLPKKRAGKKFEPDVIPGLPPTSHVLANEAAFPYWALAKVYKSDEKGSDVNLASYLLLDGFQGNYDHAVESRTTPTWPHP